MLLTFAFFISVVCLVSSLNLPISKCDDVNSDIFELDGL